MTCPACASEIPDNSTFCPRCGQTIQSAGGVVHADFVGTAMQLLGWVLLSIISACVLIPVAWVYAATGRWFCRNLKFSDGTTAAFRGTGGQIVGWVVLYLVVAIGFQVANRIAAKEGNIGLVLLLLVVYIVAISAIALQLIKWYVSMVELSPGGSLTFTGTYGGLIGWYLLVGISVYSIIGWAWASAAMYRWFARNTHGAGVEFEFHGKGHQILWRVLVYVLTCILIIPIPWMALWLMRWLVQNVTMTRSASAVA
jgi:uncharacterized membrane protein YjgN (DUF898 family)